VDIDSLKSSRSKSDRRSFIRGATVVSATALVAACSPAPQAPAKPAESKPAATTAPAAPAAKPAPAKPAEAAKPTEAAKPAAAAPAAKTGGPTGTVIKELGRDYLAYPDVKGSITFSNCWAGTRIKLVEDTWIKPFQAMYPNIKVQNDVGDCPSLQEKQTTMLASGSPSNVLMIRGGGLPFFAEQNQLDPLNDLMARDKIEQSWFYPAEMKTRIWKGKVYGLPNVTGGAFFMLYYNTKLMKKAGLDPDKPIKTWQDMDAMVEPAKKAGILVMDPFKSNVSQPAHMVYTYQNGGKYWDDDLKKIMWHEKEGVEAAEWLLQFVKAQGGKYENVAIGGNRKDTVNPPDWAPERHMLAMNGSWFPFLLKTTAPHIEYGVTTLPINGKNPNSKLATPADIGWAFSIPVKAADKEAAWEWIKYITLSKPGACEFVKAQNRPSPVIACNEDPAVAAGNPWWKVVEADLKANVPIAVTSIHPKFADLAYEMEDAFLYEKMPVKEALTSYAERAQKMLDDYNAGKR
jgi:ABC-type glycerol-3-phosphate transport system substrate-binding protein